MKEWWLLLLVTAQADGNIAVTMEDRFDYKPSCQIAAEGRQLFLTAEGIHHKQYVCIAMNPYTKEKDHNEREDSISN